MSLQSWSKEGLKAVDSNVLMGLKGTVVEVKLIMEDEFELEEERPKVSVVTREVWFLSAYDLKLPASFSLPESWDMNNSSFSEDLELT